MHIFLPYTVLVLYAAFGPIGSGLLEAAQDLGAGAMRRWTRVIMPLVAAPAASAFVFVFVLSASDYVTPEFLGGKDGIMIGVRVKENFVSTGDWPVGSALAIVDAGRVRAPLRPGDARAAPARRPQGAGS